MQLTHARRVHRIHPHRHHILAAVFCWMRKNAVLCVAIAAAVITSCIVPPDAAYLDYFDLKTLSCLFCTLAVVCALKNIRFFTILAHRIVRATGNTHTAVLTLVLITFIGSMLIANDMALLTFLPLGFFILNCTGKQKLMAFTFIMQNIAANLGGMLTPFGNPQNLYLYSHFNIPNAKFLAIMAPPFALATVMIVVCCLVFVPSEKIAVVEGEDMKLPVQRTALYLALFVLSIAIVFRTIPYWVGLIVIPAVLMFADRKALKQVDYPLLFTFVCFFIFAGNMGRMEGVRALFSALLDKSVLLFSALSCQCISNVPSAILLSQFTDNYRELLLGVNIGGAGTLIASLASLITFREYVAHNPGKSGSYILRFSAFNFAFLGVLLLFGYLLLV